MAVVEYRAQLKRKFRDKWPMTKIKTFVSGLMLSLLLMFSALTAQAAVVNTYDWGELTPVEYRTFHQERYHGFEDIYQFNVSEDFNIFALAFSEWGRRAIDNFTVGLYSMDDGHETQIFSVTNLFVIRYVEDLDSELNYFLKITGYGNYKKGSDYWGKVAVKPVPLPPALVLFLSSLLCLFGIGRRQQIKAWLGIGGQKV